MASPNSKTTINNFHNNASDLNAASGSSIQVQTQIMYGDDPSTKLHQRQKTILPKLNRVQYREAKERNPAPAPDTCQWALNHEQYKKWLECHSGSLLLISANPACGKSVLARHLVDTALRQKKRKRNSPIICHFFFKDDFLDQKKLTHALCCLLHQIFIGNTHLLDEAICQRFETYGDTVYDSVLELWDILVLVASHPEVGQIICVLDAFDECFESDQSKLSERLRILTHNMTELALSFIITSRPYSRILRIFSRVNHFHLSGEGETVSKSVAQEVERTIRHEVEKIASELGLSNDEKFIVLRNLLAVPNQTYLWVKVALNLIRDRFHLGEATISTIISDIPEGLDDTYEAILRRCNDYPQARKLLNIVLAAVRPLNLDEMAVALAVRKGSRTYKDLDILKGKRLDDHIRNLSGLFVVIIDGYIYLHHQTARDFLLGNYTHSEAQRPVWKGSFNLYEAHKILATACTWHLLFDEFFIDSGLAEGLTSDLQHSRQSHENFLPTIKETVVLKNTLFSYSSQHWDFHWRSCNFDFGGCLELEAAMFALCEMDIREHLWLHLNHHLDDLPLEESNSFAVSVYCGLLPVLRSLILQRSYFMKHQARSPYSDCITVLTWTAALEPDLSKATHGRPDAHSSQGWHLHGAAEQGHVQSVQVLLDALEAHVDRTGPSAWRFFSINSQDKQGKTALARAVINGHTDVARLLISKGADVDTEDDMGGTPLMYAMCADDGELGDLIAEQLGVSYNTHSGSEFMYTDVLYNAALAGYRRLVELILNSQSVNINQIGRSGRTALSGAIDAGSKSLVDFLLSRGADFPNLESEFPRANKILGATGFHSKSLRVVLTSGMEGALRRMLEKGLKANCDLLCYAFTYSIKDDGRGLGKDFFPHHLYQDMAIPQLLVEAGAHPDPDPEDWTPQSSTILGLSITQHDMNIFNMLLLLGARPEGVCQEKHRIYPDHAPLFQAAECGNLPVMETLFKRGISPNLPFQAISTPLHVSVYSERRGSEVTELLLMNGANPNILDGKGESPLHYAIYREDVGRALKLLRYGANPFLLNMRNMTPSDSAGPLFRERWIKTLAEYKRDSEPQLPALHAGIKSGNIKIIGKLLDEGGDIRCKLRNGNEPFHSAVALALPKCHKYPWATYAHVDSTQEAWDEVLDHRDNTTAVEVLKALLERHRGRKALNPKNNLGQTPLHLAAQVPGPEGSRLRQLLLIYGSNPTCRDIFGRLPLDWSFTEYEDSRRSAREGSLHAVYVSKPEVCCRYDDEMQVNGEGGAGAVEEGYYRRRDDPYCKNDSDYD